jgi:hypothetical protein
MGTLQAVIAHTDEKSLQHFDDEIVATVQLVEPGSWVLIGRVTVSNYDGDPQRASAKIVHDNTHAVKAEDNPVWDGIPGKSAFCFYLQAAVSTESERETFTLQCGTYDGWAKSPSLIALMVDTIKFQ